MKKITVLISGTGTNLKTLIDNCANQNIPAEIVQVIADRDCVGKKYAIEKNIPFSLIDRKLDAEIFQREIIKQIPKDIDLIVCAGFLSVIPDGLIDLFPDKIINLHPSLLPEFGGIGMYGIKVHQAVIQAGKKISGATVHKVNKTVDGGEILAQEKVAVLDGDTAEILQKRIAPIETALLINTVKKLII